MQKNVSETSIEAYRDLKESLSEKKALIFDILKKFGPMTGMEIGKCLPPDRYETQVRARLYELREAGAIYVIGKRKCKVTNKMVFLWAVNSPWGSR